MNTNDFYKELFEKYALDADKIRMNAIKQARQPAWKKAVKTYWKPVAGAAAAIAVTVGIGAYALGGSSNPGIDITVSPATALSANQRLREAEANYYNMDSDREDIVSVYLTFLEPMGYSDMIVALSAVSDCEDISVQRLYLSDGSVIDGIDAIASFASEKSGTIAAAKIYSYYSHYRDIQDLSSVYLAELGSLELNDETFTPVPVDDSDPLSMDAAVTAPIEQIVPVTTTPFSFEQETSAPDIASETTVTEEGEEAEGTDISGETDSEDITTLPPEEDDIEREESDSDNTEDNSNTEETTDTGSGWQNPVGDETTATSVGTDIPVSEITNPGDAGLMTEIYQLNVPGSLSTALYGDCAVVLTKNEVYIYSIGGMISKPKANVIAMESPKISYSDDKSVVITGCDSENKRNIMAVLDLAGDGVYTYDVSVNLGVSEIGAVHYSRTAGKYFVKAVSGSKTFIYEVIVTPETGVAFRPLVEFEAAVSIAGYSNAENKLFLQVSTDNISSTLYEFSCSDGSSVKIADFDEVCRIKRAPDFESFALVLTGKAEEETNGFVYDVSASALIPVKLNKGSTLGIKNGMVYLRTDNGLFLVSAAQGVCASTENGVVFDNICETRYYVKEATAEKVIISAVNASNWS